MVLDFAKTAYDEMDNCNIKRINGLLKPENWTKEIRDAFWLGYKLGKGEKE